MCFTCQRRWRHCYEDRFRPYVRDELAAVVAEAKANYGRIIDHFHDWMSISISPTRRRMAHFRRRQAA